MALLSVRGHERCTLKDVAGGYGTVFHVGSSIPARMLESAKNRVASLPSLTLGYIAARLKGMGLWVEAHDVNGPQAPLPDCDVAVVLSSIVDAESEREVLKRLRRLGIHTIVVGAFATARPGFYEPWADAVVEGEAECLDESMWWQTLDGHAQSVQAPSVDLDALPFPDWSAFDLRRSRYALLHHGPTLPIASARGCAYGCSYCPWRVTASFRERDPARVVAEVEYQKRERGVRAFAFRDPLFNLNPDRVAQLAEGLRPQEIRFSGEMRADRLDDALLRTLAHSGLRSLEIGVESVDASLLKRAQRNPPAPEQIRFVVRRARELGIRVICNFLLGLPEDTLETMRETVAWAKELNPFAVQFTLATPYPGTDLEAAADFDIAEHPETLTGFTPTFRHPHASADQLRELLEWAYVSYHFRPAYAAAVLRQLPTLWR